MILKLRLVNIALIKCVEIDFSNGLNVLSGETGAGKTVVISSLNFVLGAKSDKTMIRNGEDFCLAEGVFDISKNADAIRVLEDFSIDTDDGIAIVKRKLTVDGRNDIKINGSTITLSMLKEFTSTLCDVYGQSEHYSLLNESNQLKLLDKFGGEEINVLKEKIKPILSEIKNLTSKLNDFGGSKRDRDYKLDLIEYQINEIEKCGLKENEYEELLEKRKFLLNVEKIGENLQAVKSLIGDNMQGLDLISTATNKLSQISSYNEVYENLYSRLENVSIETSDILSEVSDSLDNLDFDSKEFEYIESRIDTIKNLMRKYGNSKEEIDKFYNEILLEKESLINYDDEFSKTTKLIEQNQLKLQGLYNDLSKIRKNYADKFSNSITSELKTLGMNSAKFSINLTKTDNDILSNNGVDKIEFLFSANSGEPLKPMSKVISGGEMSRFMLAMKIVSSDDISSYIFDEIDAGISGETAKIVAQKFAIISKKTQIITISHLPQIVSCSDKSFKISKEEIDGKTSTFITPLNDEGKTYEIVRLIGGENSSASFNHAKELIENANKFKKSI